MLAIVGKNGAGKSTFSKSFVVLKSTKKERYL